MGHPIFLNIQKSAIVRWVIGVCILLATALAFVAPGLGQATNFAFEGRRVNDIRIMDEHGAILPDKLPAMALEIGKPFDMEDERASLRTLYATGRYSQIRVEVALVGKELRVDFVVVRNLYNNVIRIEGLKEPPTEASALAAVQMPLGEPFRENALNDGISRLNETLKQEGLYRARVERTLEPHEATQQMDASIQIFPGPRARIGAINIVNKSSYKDEAILKRLRFKANSKQDVTSARISHGSDRLRKKLV